MYDTIIRNGKICDGSGNPWTRCDLGIVNGIIVKVGDLSAELGSTELDATGLVVAPGFIDTHVHSDLLCTRPEIHRIKVLQGVTTELLGQDGISVAPVSDQTKPLWQKQLKGLNGDIGSWPWESVNDYLTYLSTTRIIGNVSYLVPHGNIRSLVMGFAGRKARSDERRRMRELVELGMEQGAFGVSSGLVYPPNLFACKEELIEICKGAATYDGCFVVHIRNESSNILQALDEVIDVARITGVRLHISHFKVIGNKNRDLYPLALEKMASAREDGVEITFDQYPYSAGSTILHAILPPWVHSGGLNHMLERLQNESDRLQIKHDFLFDHTFENWVRNCGWENIVITSVSSERNRYVEGRNLAEIAKDIGKTPEDTALDLLLEEHGEVGMLIHWGSEEDVGTAMMHPLQIVGSDSIFGGKPHPRLSGTYPRVLGQYVREKKVLTLSEAIRRMTGAPAQLLRLQGRGLLKTGYWADITVFNPATIQDRATYESPLQEPLGIHHVLINGQLTVRNGKYCGEASGKVLFRGM